MTSTEVIHRQLRFAESLKSVVRTMRSLSAASIRQYEEASEALDEYFGGVEIGLTALFRHGGVPDFAGTATSAARSSLEQTPSGFPEKAPKHGIVAFGSGLGLCGRFNEQIVEALVRDRVQQGRASSLLLVGDRLIPAVDQAGLQMEESLDVSSSVAGITNVVSECLEIIDRWVDEEGTDAVDLMYNRSVDRNRIEVTSMRILPIDMEWMRTLSDRPWPTNQVPSATLPRSALLAGLVREHLFSSIYRAVAASQAAEHAARLMSLEAAERNIDEYIDELGRLYRESRQRAVTEEVLEIMSGWEAAGEETT